MLAPLPLVFIASQVIGPDKEIEATLNDYTKAVVAYDVERLEQLLAPDYLEVSPLGEVDLREKVLSFYRVPESQRGPTPSSVVVSELKIRYMDKSKAIAVFREDLEIARGDQKVKMSFRFTSVLTKQGKVWKLVSNHVNGIRKP